MQPLTIVWVPAGFQRHWLANSTNNNHIKLVLNLAIGLNKFHIQMKSLFLASLLYFSSFSLCLSPFYYLPMTRYPRRSTRTWILLSSNERKKKTYKSNTIPIKLKLNFIQFCLGSTAIYARICWVAKGKRRRAQHEMIINKMVLLYYLARDIIQRISFESKRLHIIQCIRFVLHRMVGEKADWIYATWHW